MAETNDWNAKIIAEFRANEGRVGGYFENTTLVLLHTTGAKSGETRVNPLACLRFGDRWAVFATKSGSPTNPDWYHNLVANPDVSFEVGTETHSARARVAEGDERDDLWSRQVAAIPTFAEYEEKSGRTIPVVVLEPTG